MVPLPMNSQNIIRSANWRLTTNIGARASTSTRIRIAAGMYQVLSGQCESPARLTTKIIVDFGKFYVPCSDRMALSMCIGKGVTLAGSYRSHGGASKVNVSGSILNFESRTDSKIVTLRTRLQNPFWLIMRWRHIGSSRMMILHTRSEAVLGS